MEFRVLGPLEVVDGDAVLPLGGPKQRAVVAHLILRAGHAVPAEQLIDELWGEEPPETARNTLQTYVYRLRKVLGEERVGSQAGAYVLHAEPGEIDAVRLEELVRSGRARVAEDPAGALERLDEALGLWPGPAFADFPDEPSLRGEIARLEGRWIGHAAELGPRLLARRRADRVRGLGRRLSGSTRWMPTGRTSGPSWTSRATSCSLTGRPTGT